MAIAHDTGVRSGSSATTGSSNGSNGWSSIERRMPASKHGQRASAEPVRRVRRLLQFPARGPGAHDEPQRTVVLLGRERERDAEVGLEREAVVFVHAGSEVEDGALERRFHGS